MRIRAQTLKNKMKQMKGVGIATNVIIATIATRATRATIVTRATRATRATRVTRATRAYRVTRATIAYRVTRAPPYTVATVGKIVKIKKKYNSLKHK